MRRYMGIRNSSESPCLAEVPTRVFAPASASAGMEVARGALRPQIA